MDLRSIETNKYVEWDDSIESILAELGDEAQINAYLHKMANIHFTNKNIKFLLKNTTFKITLHMKPQCMVRAQFKGKGH